jgi:hypothetical protein
MTRENDARWHQEIEEAITFLLLCERGFGVCDMGFFDGALLGYESVFKSITEACGGDMFGMTPDHWKLANGVSKVRGSILMGGDDEKARLVAVGANELDVLARQKLVNRGFSRMKISLDDTDQKIGYDKVSSLSRIVEVRAVAIEESGETRSLCKNYFIHDDRRKGALGGWFSAWPNQWFGGHDKPYNYDSIGFAIGACSATVSRMWWKVLVRFGGQKPGVQLYTDATGVKDFFRFREIPDGRKRRDALVHWVSDHWRQNRFDPDIENYVREHLRGSRGFDWHNLSGTIELPETEIKREKQAIDRRHRLRQDELDRRIRMFRAKGR